MRIRTGTAVAAAIVTIVVAATAAAAAPTTVARWKMDDAKKQAVVADSVGAHPGTAGNTNETLIKHREAPVTGAATGTYSTYFKGWREGWSTTNKCPSVTAGGALVTVPDVGTDTDHGGGGGGLFDPKTRPFEFTVNLRGSTLASPTAPIDISGCAASSSISLNVFQQGLFKNVGGQYKMQIEGNGLPNCLFSDDAALTGGVIHSLQVTPSTTADKAYNTAGGGSVYDPATWFTVTCTLLRPTATTATAQMTVTNKSTNATVIVTGDTGTFAGINSCTGTSQTTCSARLQAIYFGKKPGSTDPRDAFSGWLDNITFRYLD